MLKKMAYAVITSGLLLGPLGASAHDSPFPDCNYVSCATMPHTHAQKDTIVARSDSATEASGRKNRVAQRSRTSDSPFPEDNSND